MSKKRKGTKRGKVTFDEAKRLRPDGFERGRDSDGDEVGQSHLRPSDRNRHIEAPEGHWVDVPIGMVAAAGTYVDSSGVLRSVSDDSCVVWHKRGCERRGIQPDEIIYNDNGAPWCPSCVEVTEDKAIKIATEAFESDESEQEIKERLRRTFGA